MNQEILGYTIDPHQMDLLISILRKLAVSTLDHDNIKDMADLMNSVLYEVVNNPIFE